ncbi:MAG: nucleotidyl transferase AbiEii/AbiGii toxin family protein [Clostridiales bacterium]|jgi:predicted nucleotidyltransferase component of viral defense system|nr:nucleotidyl transferase AbiEii/AbiGii toxin family protein [Clostridiales bacterium]
MNLVDPGIVEKYYYVTLFLKRISELQHGIIFKGGTSLSKCYKAIRRFSEDIDLSVETELAKLTEGQRKRLKTDIVSIIDEYGFTLMNPEQIRSRRDFNKYVIDFHPARMNLSIKQNMIVETSVYIKAFPTSTMKASSHIYDFLKANGAGNLISQYGLEHFELKVLSLERTFIDKVFALADYYLDGNIEAHSRHIYDLYKLYPKIQFNCGFRKLVQETRKVRKPHITCKSAQEGIDLNMVLQRIITEDFYESDYKNITTVLLFEKVTYQEAIPALRKIIDNGFFT